MLLLWQLITYQPINRLVVQASEWRILRKGWLQCRIRSLLRCHWGHQCRNHSPVPRWTDWSRRTCLGRDLWIVSYPSSTRHATLWTWSRAEQGPRAGSCSRPEWTRWECLDTSGLSAGRKPRCGSSTRESSWSSSRFSVHGMCCTLCGMDHKYHRASCRWSSTAQTGVSPRHHCPRTTWPCHSTPGGTSSHTRCATWRSPGSTLFQKKKRMRGVKSGAL